MNLNTKLVTIHLQTIYRVSSHMLHYHATTVYSSSRIECYFTWNIMHPSPIHYPSSTIHIIDQAPPHGVLNHGFLSLKHL